MSGGWFGVVGVAAMLTGHGVDGGRCRGAEVVVTQLGSDRSGSVCVTGAGDSHGSFAGPAAERWAFTVRTANPGAGRPWSHEVTVQLRDPGSARRHRRIAPGYHRALSTLSAPTTARMDPVALSVVEVGGEVPAEAPSGGIAFVPYGVRIEIRGSLAK